MIEFASSFIAGCHILRPQLHDDSRGRFVKFFQTEAYAALGLHTEFNEDFYTNSHRGVVRGMHFQAPPQAQIKLVSCVAGRVLDVILDLRIGSPTYGQRASFQLDSNSPTSIYMVEGLAHGFCTLSDEATLLYKVSRSYSPECDQGIAWNSFGMQWPVNDPLLSERDRRLPPLADFQSPFIHAG